MHLIHSPKSKCFKHNILSGPIEKLLHLKHKFEVVSTGYWDLRGGKLVAEKNSFLLRAKLKKKKKT